MEISPTLEVEGFGRNCKRQRSVTLNCLNSERSTSEYAGPRSVLWPTLPGKTRLVEAVAEEVIGSSNAVIKIDCGEFGQVGELVLRTAPLMDALPLRPASAVPLVWTDSWSIASTGSTTPGMAATPPWFTDA